MQIQKEMLNGHGICHGGVTFSLADTAFAYACNSHNRKTVALNCLISFSRAANEGDELTAVAKEQALGKTTGTYDVTVTNQNAEVVALFRGASYSTKQEVASLELLR
jgi:acyl-CoA thioesterase